jgi:hypothetical protein
MNALKRPIPKKGLAFFVKEIPKKDWEREITNQIKGA